MIKEEILKMPAGREMDALVAEKIIKIEFHPQFTGNKFQWFDFYSTDISAAWDVIEKNPESHIVLERIFYERRKLEYSAEWDCTIDDTTATAKTAPLAICRASLLCVLGEKEATNEKGEMP